MSRMSEVEMEELRIPPSADSPDPLRLSSPRPPQPDHYRLSMPDLQDFVSHYSNGCTDLSVEMRELAFEIYEKTEFLEDAHNPALTNDLWEHAFSEMDTVRDLLSLGAWNLTAEQRLEAAARLLGITFCVQIGPFSEFALGAKAQMAEKNAAAAGKTSSLRKTSGPAAGTGDAAVCNHDSVLDAVGDEDWKDELCFWAEFSRSWRVLLAESYAEGKHGGEMCFGLSFDSRAKILSLLASLQEALAGRNLNITQAAAKKMQGGPHFNLRLRDVEARLKQQFYHSHPLEFYTAEPGPGWEAKRIAQAEEKCSKAAFDYKAFKDSRKAGRSSSPKRVSPMKKSPMKMVMKGGKKATIKTGEKGVKKAMGMKSAHLKVVGMKIADIMKAMKAAPMKAMKAAPMKAMKAAAMKSMASSMKARKAGGKMLMKTK